MKAFFTYHWQRLCAWLERVQRLQERIVEQDAEIARLHGRITALEAEVKFTRERAEEAESQYKQAARGNELLSRWIKTTHRLGDPPERGSIKELLQNANHR